MERDTSRAEQDRRRREARDEARVIERDVARHHAG
jgi:hypothetical protein